MPDSYFFIAFLFPFLGIQTSVRLMARLYPFRDLWLPNSSYLILTKISINGFLYRFRAAISSFVKEQIARSSMIDGVMKPSCSYHKKSFHSSFHSYRFSYIRLKSIQHCPSEIRIGMLSWKVYLSGIRCPQISFSVVDLPDPFSPMKP